MRIVIIYTWCSKNDYSKKERHTETTAGGPTSRCSGRALRDEIGRILERDFVLRDSSIQAARR
jgi:hypothetical protein